VILLRSGHERGITISFTEQEITGDVLLELDVNLLKAEIGIMTFGKRMRIANAIADLRRPPSVVYSDHASSPRSPIHSNPFSTPAPRIASPIHSRTQSQAASQAYPYAHTPSQSLQNSAQPSLHGPPSAGSGQMFMISPESGFHTGDIIGSAGTTGFSPYRATSGERDVREMESNTISNGFASSGIGEPRMVGLGIEAPRDIRSVEKGGVGLIQPQSGLHFTRLCRRVDHHN
jgi:hypothetical protein